MPRDPKLPTLLALPSAPHRGRPVQHKLIEDIRKLRGAVTAKHGRVAIQAAGLLALTVLIVRLLWTQVSHTGDPPTPSDIPAVADQQVARGVDVGCDPRYPSPLGDPDRIKQILKPGRTYAIQTKGGFVARATDIDCGGNGRTVNVAHAFEMLVTRTIESNDGHRIVEVRHFEKVWAVTLLSEAEDVGIELGPPGEVLLGTLEDVESHVGTRRVAVRPVAEAILRAGAEAVAADATSEAFWEVDSLSGKTVRITYVDGVGVESIQPLGCAVWTSECAFLCSTPVVWGAYVMPDEKVEPDKSCSVDATLLAALMPPSMRQIPTGEIVIERNGDSQENGKQWAHLRIQSSRPQQSTCDTFSPKGDFRYNISDTPVETASLNWRAKPDYLARLYPPHEHLLPKVVLYTEPTVTLSYCCKIRRPVEAARASGPHPWTAAAARHEQERWWYAVGDLLVGILILLTFSIILFRCGMKIARHRSKAASVCMQFVAVVLILLFTTVQHGKLFLAQILPFSNVIVLGNWIPPSAAFLAGIVGGQDTIPRWRRGVVALILISLGWYTVLYNFLAPCVPSGNSFQNGVCVQTSAASCSPASAVTLLDSCGIESNEREMARLCLTNKNGTSLLGLYRGLKLKTHNTGWAVEVVRCSVEELRQADSWPVLLPVRLDSTPVIGLGKTGRGRGSVPRSDHTVVLFGFTEDGRAEIGDPSNWVGGRTEWTVEELKRDWCGEGLRLTKRDP